MNAGAPLHRRPVRLAIIDQSAVFRQFVRVALQREADVDIIAVAPEAAGAAARVAALRPDAVLLEVDASPAGRRRAGEQAESFAPAIVIGCVHGLPESLAQMHVRGIAGFIAAPDPDALGSEAVARWGSGFARHLRMQCAMRPHALGSWTSSPAAAVTAATAAATGTRGTRPAGGAAETSPVPAAPRPDLVAIGLSTGGTTALERVLLALPAECPPIVVVQHMPEGFTGAFARRLDAICAMRVLEASDGDEVRPGQVLIAPGGRHLEVLERDARLRAHVHDGPAVSRHRPSVNVLFRSLVRLPWRARLAILMTGMGADGADGLLELRNAGCRTIAQDEASSVVFGMPREAILRDAVDEIRSLDDIAAAILGDPVRHGGRAAGAGTD